MRPEMFRQIQESMTKPIRFMSPPQAAVYVVESLAMGDKNYSHLVGSIKWRNQDWELSETVFYLAIDPLFKAGIITDYRQPRPNRGRPWRTFRIADPAKAFEFIAACLPEGHGNSAA